VLLVVVVIELPLIASRINRVVSAGLSQCGKARTARTNVVARRGIIPVLVSPDSAHKANSLKKLNMESRKDIVRYAITKGWTQEN
jgi:hypothetical protein